MNSAGAPFDRLLLMMVVVVVVVLMMTNEDDERSGAGAFTHSIHGRKTTPTGQCIMNATPCRITDSIPRA